MTDLIIVFLFILGVMYLIIDGLYAVDHEQGFQRMKAFIPLPSTPICQKPLRQASQSMMTTVIILLVLTNSETLAAELRKPADKQITHQLDKNLKKYYIDLIRKINSNWHCDDVKESWNLKSIAVIILNKDGKIINSFFEYKSNNRYFNQCIEKTIRLSAPFDKFPKEINENELELGIKFKSSGIF